jgi:hypothetical protein
MHTMLSRLIALKHFSESLRVTVLGLFILFLCISPAFANGMDESERIARLAMSTASLWMVEHHEHDISKALKSGDLKEALHETEELISWMKGTPWSEDLDEPAIDLLEALESLAGKLKKKDKDSAAKALEGMEKAAHHLHHELMELVAEGAEKKKGGGHSH